MAKYYFNAKNIEKSNGRMTIVCDASFCPDSKLACFSVWYASNHYKGSFTAEVTTCVHSSTSAELIAVVAAIHNGLAQGFIKEDMELLIQTDCQHVVELLKGNFVERDSYRFKLMQQLQYVLIENNIGIDSRHVKGHTGNKDNRSLANKYCDERARAALNIARMKRVMKVNTNKKFEHELQRRLLTLKESAVNNDHYMRLVARTCKIITGE